MFFLSAAAFTFILTLGICRIYPDKPYASGDVAVLPPWPRFGRVSKRISPCSDLCAGMEDARSTLATARYWGFCLTFGWGALVAQWAVGAVGSALFFPGAPEFYFTWAHPVLTNATFLFSPFIGALIDRTGFSLAGLLVLASAIVLIALLWVRPRLALGRFGMSLPSTPNRLA